MLWGSGRILGEIPGDLAGCQQAEHAVGRIQQMFNGALTELSRTMTFAPEWKGATQESFKQALDKEYIAFDAVIRNLAEAKNAIATYNAALLKAQQELQELEEDAQRRKAEFESTQSGSALLVSFYVTTLYFVLMVSRMCILMELERIGEEQGAILFEALHREPNPGETGKMQPLIKEDFDKIIKDLENLDPSMVDQNAIGDCYYLAALASILQTKEGRDFIRNSIRVHHNAQGEPDGFLVTLYEKDHSGNFKPRQVFVQDVYRSGVRHDEGAGISIASIYEAAYAQTKHGGTLDHKHGGIHGGFPADAFESITGTTSKRDITLSRWWDFGAAQSSSQKEIITAISDGRAVVTACYSEASVQVGETTIVFPSGHAYSILDANESGVMIRNPWGVSQGLNGHIRNDGKVFISWDDYYRIFGSADISGDFKGR